MWNRTQQKFEDQSLRLIETEYASLALKEVRSHFGPDRKYNILDLGPASASNVAFFSQYSCKLYIEDLYRSFSALSAEERNGEAVFEQLLPYAENVHFDLILAWDLFNYLSGEQLARLSRHLARFCNPGTWMLALLSTVKEIPATPIQFKIRDEQKVFYEVDPRQVRPCERYQPRELEKIIVDFKIYRSYLLRNGMQETICMRREPVDEQAG